jgi:hypothetical protein
MCRSSGAGILFRPAATNISLLAELTTVRTSRLIQQENRLRPSHRFRDREFVIADEIKVALRDPLYICEWVDLEIV